MLLFPPRQKTGTCSVHSHITNTKFALKKNPGVCCWYLASKWKGKGWKMGKSFPRKTQASHKKAKRGHVEGMHTGVCEEEGP